MQPTCDGVPTMYILKEVDNEYLVLSTVRQAAKFRQHSINGIDLLQQLRLSLPSY